MKKLMLILVLLISSLSLMFAQNNVEYNVMDVPETLEVCVGTVVTIHAESNCGEWFWKIDNVNQGMINPLVLQSQVGHNFRVEYYGCNFSLDSHIIFRVGDTPTSFTHDVWKRFGETMTIEPVGTDSLSWYEYLWSTGATTRTIDVTEPGTYTCQIFDFCGTATRTFIVRDNVEIYRSGVDPLTDLNKVRWNTTPAQAAYVSSVKIERDGMVVGTAPYLDGEFLDNIGSENAARIYKITAIDTDGNECPLPSYQFGTFNTIISPDIANPSLMNFTWEDPFIEEGSPYSVIAYRVGRFNENTGEFIMLDQLSANVHIAKYNMDLFDGDYGIVAAVFNDAKNRDYEELAFSNRSADGIVGVGELNATSFSLYPNPSHGEFTVEGPQTLTIFNTMGQVVATSYAENGMHTISLSSAGVYFVKSDEGVVGKVVIE